MPGTPLPDPPSPDSMRHLWHVLRVALRSVKLRPGFRAIQGLSPAQMEALEFIAGHPDAILRELGAALGVPKSTLTGLIDRLEKQGLVERVIRAGDRRSFGLALTERGRKAYAVYLDYESTSWSGILRSLGSRERQAEFLDQMAVMVKALQASSGGDRRHD